MPVYRNNPRAFDEEILLAPWMAALMKAHAERGMAAAIAATPVGPGPDHFIDHFSVATGVQHGRRGDRVYAEVVNNDEHAAAKEFGHIAQNGRPVGGIHSLEHALAAMGNK